MSGGSGQVLPPLAPRDQFVSHTSTHALSGVDEHAVNREQVTHGFSAQTASGRDRIGSQPGLIQGRGQFRGLRGIVQCLSGNLGGLDVGDIFGEQSAPGSRHRFEIVEAVLDVAGECFRKEVGHLR